MNNSIQYSTISSQIKANKLDFMLQMNRFFEQKIRKQKLDGQFDERVSNWFASYIKIAIQDQDQKCMLVEWKHTGLCPESGGSKPSHAIFYTFLSSHQLNFLISILVILLYYFINSHIPKDTIYFIHFMENLLHLVGQNIQLFEKCATSLNPKQYLQNLPQSHERNLLLFLIEPYNPNYEKTLQEKYQLPPRLVSLIMEWKKAEKIQDAHSVEEIRDLILQYKYQAGFDHVKPLSNEIEKEEGKQGDKEKEQNVLPVLESLEEWVLSSLNFNESIIRQMKNRAIRAIPLQTIYNLSTQSHKTILHSEILINMFPQDFVLRLIEKYNTAQKADNENFILEERIVKALPTRTFQQLKHIIPSFTTSQLNFQISFTRTFHSLISKYEKNELTIIQKNEKKRLMLDILTWHTNQNSPKFSQFRRKFHLEVLELDIQRQDFDENFFFDFLKEFPVGVHFFKGQQMRENPLTTYNIQMCYNFKARQEEELMMEYFKGLFKQSNAGNNLTRLNKYFEESKLNKIYAETVLLNGGDITEVQRYLDTNQIRNLKQRKSLIILPNTKKQLKVDDDVQLKLKVKNISKIKVKLYRIDLEKQYLEGIVFNADQDLSYLNPIKSYIYNVDNSNPYKEEYYDIKVDQIGKTRGKWIVDLQADEMSSRALICKGGIKITEKSTAGGIQLSFYYENNEHIKNLHIWINDKKHIVRQHFLIPYRQNQSKYEQILAVTGSYAQKTQVFVTKEAYNFNINYIYNSENFLVNKKATVLLLPCLSIGGVQNKVNVKLIKNKRIKVKTVNTSSGENTEIFENVEFKNNEGFRLELPISTFTQRIKIMVQGTINLLNGNQQKVISQKEILIQTNTLDFNQFIDFYLRQTNQTNYSLFALGKNGQPIPSLPVDIFFIPYDRLEQKKYSLKTNQEGQIMLGNIRAITDKIGAQLSAQAVGQIKKCWVLREMKNEVDLAKRMTYLRGEIINLRCPVQKSDILLLEKNQFGIVIENWSGNIEKKTEQMLTISNLSPGIYHLYIEGLESIQIIVREDLVQKENNMFYSEETHETLHRPDYEHHKIEIKHRIESSQECLKLMLKIESERLKNRKQWQIIVLGSNFICPFIEGMFKLQEMRVKEKELVSLYQRNKNSYFQMPKQQYSEELLYAKNRENAVKCIGNNLTKPKIFLKGIDTEVKITQEIAQIWNRPQELCCNLECCEAPNMFGKPTHLYGRNTCTFQSSKITSHQNFLTQNTFLYSTAYSPILYIDIPHGYSHFQVLLVSSRSAIHKIFNHPSPAIQKKDITNRGLMPTLQNKGWAFETEIRKVKKDEKVRISAESKWRIIGIENILGFARSLGVEMEDWIEKWRSYSNEKKQKVYDDKVCHELNLFIKNNDTPFFERVVRPFISNKINKTFVDHYLLENKQCEQWAQIDKVIKLNAFEKVLLVKYLMKCNKEEKAMNIATTMHNQTKATEDGVVLGKEVDKLLYTMDEKCNKWNSLNIQCEEQADILQEQEEPYQDMMLYQNQDQQRAQIIRPFPEMQTTKQYTETTYAGITNPQQSTHLIPLNSFWSQLAVSSYQEGSNMFGEKIVLLKTTQEFTLAACLFPYTNPQSYQIRNIANKAIIEAKSDLLLLTKEMKQLNYQRKYGIMINQAIFDPRSMYTYEEDGSKMEQPAKNIIIGRQYVLRTLITNTSNTQLKLNLLIDIPRGSIPIDTHQNKQNYPLTVNPYETKILQKKIYFPEEGSYSLYPANATRSGAIIAKAESLPLIQVKKYESKGVIESFQQILKSGNKEQILNFLNYKNIFDDKVFDLSSILWMFKDKDFYLGAIDIFRRRSLFAPEIWTFGYLHEDIIAIKQLHKTTNNEVFPLKLSVFEYFPYYSSRTHKFQNENKATITNTEFKNSYFELLFAATVSKPPKHYIAVLIYYLLLQDKVQEASELLNRVDDETRRECIIQFDYIECFIDMSKGYPLFSKARKISEKYAEYPVIAWQRMFQEVINTLKEYDSQEMSTLKKKQVEFEAKVLNEGHQLRLSIPPQTEMEVLVYDISLQLYFSMFPFETVKNICSYVVPNKIHQFQAGEQPKVVIFQRPQSLKDSIIEVYHCQKGLQKKKLDEFQWSNSEIQIRINEEKGSLQIYLSGKVQPGCYCKVFQKIEGESSFYRDGYSDINGRFKYALKEVDKIEKFAILVMTEKGGVTKIIDPPSSMGYLS